MVWPRKSFGKIDVYQSSQQNSDTVLQDNGRKTLKVIQRTPHAHHRTRVQGLGTERFQDVPTQCLRGGALTGAMGVRPLKRAMGQESQPRRAAGAGP